MMRYLTMLIVLACVLAVPAYAGENHNADLGFSSAHLVKSSFTAGQGSVEFLAGSQVDVAGLIVDIDLSKPGSAQSIADRVNEKRMLLYPKEEIILSITPAENARPVDPEQKVALVKAIYWWNNNNCSTCFWFAQYTSTVATMFISNVKFGSYNIYDKIGSGDWVYRSLTRAGGSATRYSYGSRTLRGFKGATRGVASKADIVMYFFN